MKESSFEDISCDCRIGSLFQKKLTKKCFFTKHFRWHQKPSTRNVILLKCKNELIQCTNSNFWVRALEFFTFFHHQEIIFQQLLHFDLYSMKASQCVIVYLSNQYRRVYKMVQL